LRCNDHETPCIDHSVFFLMFSALAQETPRPVTPAAAPPTKAAAPTRVFPTKPVTLPDGGSATHIVQFAREIAGEAGLAPCIVPVDDGIGFVCSLPSRSLADSGRAVLRLLSLLSGDAPPALSDAGLIKLFRLLRLSQRLRDIEADPDGSGH
jgi:hypothetical protein